MGKYEAAFSRLGERALAQLEGPGGFLAVTETHLILVDEEGVKRLELARIRRVGRGEAGTLAVQGEAEALAIPLKAFPLEELKAFLEGLKPHVARARKATATPPPRGEAPPRPAPPPPSPAPTPREEASRPSLWEEESPPKRASVELAPEPEPVPPPAPAEAPKEKGRQRNPLALPLKALSLLTLGYTLGFVALNPGADPWALAGVVLGGIGLALAEWSLATSWR
ncbi:YcxB family protein [Thermus sp.]|uniref:YcxB family protein n=1 Tax=Thermus sp. TaxID=275 RepID=UPI0025CF6D0F|nr:YcxB family protein [Thermus sp.]MCS6868446.1 YcxB family protein [Thermus sp.]MCX7848810.1 YcxB family protein [Thermus sp.]MDW8357406.1 YcxB family protein [Thermus sp.]